MSRLFSLIKVLFWLSAVVLTVASLVPVALLPPQTFNVWDKAQHALGFGWLTLVGLFAYPKWPLRMAVCLLLYGGAIELAQAATGWRYGEWTDLLADGVGVVVGALLWLGLRQCLRPQCLKAIARRAQ